MRKLLKTEENLNVQLTYHIDNGVYSTRQFDKTYNYYDDGGIIIQEEILFDLKTKKETTTKKDVTKLWNKGFFEDDYRFRWLY